MQRSAAKAVSNSPSSPTTPNGPPSKRVRLSNGTAAPATPSDHEVIQAALAAEEKKREEALEKSALTSGETKWVLSFNDPKAGQSDVMRVREVGFGELDETDSDSEVEVKAAIRSFGGGLKSKKSDAKGAKDESESETSSSSSSSGDDSDDYDSDDPTEMLIRETKREQARKNKAAKKASTARTTANLQTPKREVDLAGLTSLSGRPTVGACFVCGRQGHMQMNCPEKQQRQSRHQERPFSNAQRRRF
ncbi:hypothetical protein EJ04DRAFT_512583 [Polyplosphaeria fusca]|uniref:CCHC-type domain-containing protein n=1 Tax=Polyplosphaeria fusca TaxID=682080 RepID=A0A9P4R090_9PLEO|nr:hypothetical protein EJ04DRAFT_512583 [Polyplosphaeria fusca]